MRNHHQFRARKYLIAGALSVGTIGSLVMGLTMTSTPAHAQLTVFDPGNYSQNLLTAARTLQQINNQIQSLQNEANMLVNQAKNLTRIDFPELQALTQTLQQVDRLMVRRRVSSSAFPASTSSSVSFSRRASRPRCAPMTRSSLPARGSTRR